MTSVKEQVEAERKAKKLQFMNALAAELRALGREVEFNGDVDSFRPWLVVDGRSVSITIDVQRKPTSMRFGLGRETGRLYVSFNERPWSKYGGNRAYTAPEGRDGLNAKKAAKALHDQLQERTNSETAQKSSEERFTKAAKAAERLNAEHGLNRYGGTHVAPEASSTFGHDGKLTIHGLNEEEASALLALLKTLRKG